MAKNELLIQARTEKGWLQKEAAERLGVSEVTVRRWEQGRVLPFRLHQQRLCELYQKSMQELGFMPAEAGRSFSSTLDARLINDPLLPTRAPIPLVGRDDVIHEVVSMLLAGKTPIVLHGLPGVGKTALATMIAHDPSIRAHFHDGILWASLGSHPHMLSLLGRWGNLFHLSSSQMGENQEDWIQALRMTIGQRSLLVVIDDVWNIDEALMLQIGGAHCAYLMTTRFPQIASHIAIDSTIPLRELELEQGIDLLARLAPQVIEREAGEAGHLVQSVGGLPLALLLMGNYLRTQGYTQQPRRIQAAFQHLKNAEDRLRISAPAPGHTTGATSLQSVIAISDQLLNEEARSALYLLSVLPAKPETFSEEVAIAITEAPYEIIDHLVDVGLLECNTGRYSLHQTIADYAQFHLSATDAAVAYTRLVTYASAFATQYRDDFERLEQEFSVLLAALDYGRQHLPDTSSFVNLVCNFSMPLIGRGWYQFVLPFILQAKSYAQGLDRAKLLVREGQVLMRMNQPTAETCFQEALTIEQLTQEHQFSWDLLTSLANIAATQGELETADALTQKALSIAKEHLGEREIIQSRTSQAWLMLQVGKLQPATEVLQECLLIAREYQSQHPYSGIIKTARYTILSNLAHCMMYQKEIEKAEELFEEALNLASQLHSQEREMGILLSLSHVKIMQTVLTEPSKREEAEQLCHRVLSLAQTPQHSLHISVTLMNLALLARLQEHHQQEISYFQQAFRVARQHRLLKTLAAVHQGAKAAEDVSFQNHPAIQASWQLFEAMLAEELEKVQGSDQHSPAQEDEI